MNDHKLYCLRFVVGSGVLVGGAAGVMVVTLSVVSVVKIPSVTMTRVGSSGVVGVGGVPGPTYTPSTSCLSAELLTHRSSWREELNFEQSRCSGHDMFLSLRKPSQPARALSHVSRHGVAMYLSGSVGLHCGK